MSGIQVLKAEHQTRSNLGRCFYIEMTSGKHHVTVAVAPDHLNVIVHNASNRAWGGLGKRFPDLISALANYKTPEVRSMIKHAVAQSAEQVAA
jgi:hypothetical protein